MDTKQQDKKEKIPKVSSGVPVLQHYTVYGLVYTALSQLLICSVSTMVKLEKVLKSCKVLSTIAGRLAELQEDTQSLSVNSDIHAHGR